LYLDLIMALRLIVETAQESISSYVYHFDQPEVRVGRSPLCELQIPLPTISNHHLTILREGARYLVREEGSTNGARLNGAPLAARAAAPLQTHDQITILEVRLHVHLLDIEEASLTSQGRTGELARQMISAWLQRQRQAPEAASLEVLEGPDQGARRALPTEGELVIGEGGPWALTDPLLARVTLRVAPSRGGYHLVSAAAVWVDGAPAPAGAPLRLRSGQRLRVGGTTLLFLDPLQVHLDGVEDAPTAAPPSPSPAAPPSPPARSALDWALVGLAAALGLGALALLGWIALA
jgi:predicted component of type VI protein secretion system